MTTPLDFTEIMRALGYPRLISVENFRTPNFELVADILNWLVHRFGFQNFNAVFFLTENRYDPNLQLNFQIATEEERVQFLKLTSEFMVGHPLLNI